MPFPKKPDGISAVSLRLLDLAMTRAWLVQVATGASESNAEAAVCADLWERVERLDQVRGGATKRRRQHKNMADHKFKVGQKVLYHPGRASVGPALFTITRVLPVEGGVLTYRIKSQMGTERVAKEHELANLQGDLKP